VCEFPGSGWSSVPGKRLVKNGTARISNQKRGWLGEGRPRKDSVKKTRERKTPWEGVKSSQTSAWQATYHCCLSSEMSGSRTCYRQPYDKHRRCSIRYRPVLVDVIPAIATAVKGLSHIIAVRSVDIVSYRFCLR